MTTKGTGNRQKAGLTKGKKSMPTVVDKFVIRLPEGLRDQIKALSEHNRRSMNSEIIMVLEQYIQQASKADTEDDMDMVEGTNELVNGQNTEVGTDAADAADVESYQMTDQELSEKLEALPPEKKEALLSLLG